MKTYSLILIDEVPSANGSLEFQNSPDFLDEKCRRVRPCGGASEPMRAAVQKIGFPCRVSWEAPEKGISREKDNFFPYYWMGFRSSFFPDTYTVTPVEQDGPNPD